MTDQPGAEEAEGGGAPRLMRGAVIAVVVMGLLILAGLVVIGVEVYRRATDPDYKAQVEERSRARGPASASRVAGPLVLPPGTEIVAAVPVGDRLAVTLRHRDGSQALLLVDSGTGEAFEVLRTRPE